MFHRNAKLGLAGRLALVSVIEAGSTVRAAAADFNVSPATAHRWWHRWHEGSDEARKSLSCLFDRSSRPRHSPRQLAPELAERICDCRRKTGWGPRLIAGATGFAHSTIWRVLHRAGISRPPRPSREPANSYEWPCPGDHTIRHLTTRPYRPRTNGKVERFHQTMAREWAYGLTYQSHADRAKALPHWLQHYNHNRPHSSLGGHPPISRVHNLRGQDI
jgi:transposase InsO family protein